jgi:hypothetical protein
MTDRMRRVTARNGRMALACALGVLLTTAPAAAQNSEQIVEIESYRIPGWSFTPSVAVGTVYDNNIGLTAPRADLGQTQGDTVFNVVPGAQLEYIRKRTDFSVGYRGFVRRYLSVDGLDSFDQRASMGLKHLVSRRLTLFARDSYLDTPTTDETELNGVPFRRTGSRNNTFAAGSEYRVTKFVKLSTRYDSTWVAFDRPEIYLTGGWIHALRNELSYQVSKHVSLGGEYAYRRAALDEGQRRFDFQDMGGVAHFALSAHTEASAAGGYATLRDHNFHTTRTGPYVRVGIAHMLDRATVGANFDRQYVPSFGFGGSSNNQELRGYVQMPVRQRLYTQASATWRRTMPFETETLAVDSIWLRTAFGYSASRWMRLEALYTYTSQDSIVTGGEVSRHRIGAQFVISQPMRIQ